MNVVCGFNATFGDFPSCLLLIKVRVKCRTTCAAYRPQRQLVLEMDVYCTWKTNSQETWVLKMKVKCIISAPLTAPNTNKLQTLPCLLLFEKQVDFSRTHAIGWANIVSCVAQTNRLQFCLVLVVAQKLNPSRLNTEKCNFLDMCNVKKC